MIYSIYAYRGDDYAQVTLEIKANKESEAITKAKTLVDRDNYVVTNIREE